MIDLAMMLVLCNDMIPFEYFIFVLKGDMLYRQLFVF